MKEYNWREERKKYQANGSRSNDNDAQQQPQTPPPVQPAVAVAVAAAPRKPSMAVIALLSLLAIAVIGIFVLLFTRSSDPKPEKIEKIAAGKINVSLPDQPAASDVSSPIVVTTGSQDTALQLQQQAEKHKYAVGVVAATLELKTGNKFVNAIIYYDTDKKLKTVDEKLVSIISQDYKSIYHTFAKNKSEKEKLYLRLLLVTDYICGMTDSFAKNLYQELNGIQ